MKFTAEQIAGILEGEVEGNPLIDVSTLSKIEEGEKGSLTFLANPKYKPYIYSTEASIVIVDKAFVADKPVKATLIKVEDAYIAFSTLLEYYNQAKAKKAKIEQPSFVAESSKIGSNLYLGAFSYIGENVVIGDNVKIFPNCYIDDNVVIGNGTTLFAGAKVYSDSIIGKNAL